MLNGTGPILLVIIVLLQYRLYVESGATQKYFAITTDKAGLCVRRDIGKFDRLMRTSYCSIVNALESYVHYDNPSQRA